MEPPGLLASMSWSAAYGVALQDLRQHQVGLRARLEREELVGARLAVQGRAQALAVDGDGDRVHPVAVDDGRDLALAAEPTRGAGAELSADLGGKGDVGPGWRTP